MGQKGRPLIQTSEIPIPPEIAIIGDRICWSIRNWKRIRLVRPRRAMLDQFLSLSNAAAEQICTFARKYGVLAICEHGKPTSHNLDCEMAPCPEINGWSEPLDRWRYYAKQFQAVLRIADRLNRNELGSREDWVVLDPQQDPNFRTATSKTFMAAGVAGARNRLASIVNDFLDLGAVRPELCVDGPNWRVYYHSVAGNTLFGAIAIQLVLAVASVDGFATCSACGNPYLPERTPKVNQNNYCSKGCRQKGQARASQKYRQRQSDRAGKDVPLPEPLVREVLGTLYGIKPEKVTLDRTARDQPPTLETIGLQLNRLREECRWTEEQLAERISISLRSVQRHLAGESIPYSRHIHAYERVFSKRLERQVVIDRMSCRCRDPNMKDIGFQKGTQGPRPYARRPT